MKKQIKVKIEKNKIEIEVHDPINTIYTHVPYT